jgi:predicted nucleic acid-binding protein/tetrahydromethanopterin S-methyltransferase subunit F
MTTAVLPISIEKYLASFVARRRRLAVVSTVGIAAAGFLVWMLLVCALDRFAQIPGPVRLLALLASLAAAGLLAFRPLLYLARRRFDRITAAQEIERCHSAHAQRLVTVVSQMLAHPDHRGSNELLETISVEVHEQVSSSDATSLIPASAAIKPWIAFTALLIVAGVLCTIPSFGLPKLMLRFFDPLAALPPVTTTRLVVHPGPIDVIEGQPLPISVSAVRLGDSPVTLHLSDDTHSWTAWPMISAANGEFSYTIASVDRDLSYYITGGDATSLTYPVRVLRAPAVAEFRIHYAYPQYTGQKPLVVSNSDGLVEAPTGTEATIDVRSTEPLADAMLNIEQQHLPMSETLDPQVREAKITVTKDQRYNLQLIGRNGVHGNGPNTTAIHAIPDRPPLVRLIDPADDLRLSPHDILPLQYEALDDYGLHGLSAQVQLNSQPAVPIDIRLSGDIRHQQGVYNLDLATFKPNIGDVISIWLQAQDTSGQSSISEVRHILVSPRSIDLNTHQRIAELASAAQLANSLVSELDAAGHAMDEAVSQGDHLSDAYLAAVAKTNRHLALAGEDAALLRQGLLRAILHSASSTQSITLADLVDSAQICSAICEDLVGTRTDTTDADRQARNRLNDANNDSHRLVDWLHVLSVADQSTAVLADRQNLAASQNQPAPKDHLSLDRLKETRARAKADIAEAVTTLGMNPDAGDLDAQLTQRIAAGDSLCKSQQPVDFVGASRDWANQLGKPQAWRELLDRRLSAAAQAEAVRPDADLIRARDLQLASKAAAKLSADANPPMSSPAATPPAPPQLPTDIATAYPAAMDAMNHEHELLSRPNDVRPPNEIAQIHDNATKARDQMRHWAGEEDLISNAAANAASPVSLQDLVMAANAAAAKHQYEQAQKLDQQQSQAAAQQSAANDQSVASKQQQQQDAVKASMARAENIDKLQADQQRLREQTDIAKTDQAQALANQQNDIAKRIDDAKKDEDAANEQNPQQDPDQNEEDPDYREEKAAALSKAQEQLAAMPEQLTNVGQQFGEKQKSADTAAAADHDAAAANGDAKAAAKRSADAARQQLADAQQHLDQAAQPVDPSNAQEMSSVLSKYAPQTDQTVRAVNEQLLPALRSLQQGLKSSDPGQVNQSIADARRAIGAAQQALADAQQQLMERDPLVAAKWYAKQAADALQRTPPDLQSAKQNQQNASAALAKAWDKSIHGAAAQRLAQVPSMLSLFELYPLRSDVSGAGITASPAEAGTPVAREWGRLREHEPNEMNASIRESDPPGYEDALKVYFQALGQSTEGKK